MNDVYSLRNMIVKLHNDTTNNVIVPTGLWGYFESLRTTCVQFHFVLNYIND